MWVRYEEVHLVRVIAPLKRNHFRRTRNGNIKQNERQTLHTDEWTHKYTNNTSPSTKCAQKVPRRKREQWSAAKHNKQPLATCNRARTHTHTVHIQSGRSVCRLPHATDGTCLCTWVSVLKINCLACSLAEVLHEKSLVTMGDDKNGRQRRRQRRPVRLSWCTLFRGRQAYGHSAKRAPDDHTMKQQRCKMWANKIHWYRVQKTNTSVSVFVTLSDSLIILFTFSPESFCCDSIRRCVSCVCVFGSCAACWIRNGFDVVVNDNGDNINEPTLVLKFWVVFIEIYAPHGIPCTLHIFRSDFFFFFLRWALDVFSPFFSLCFVRCSRPPLLGTYYLCHSICVKSTFYLCGYIFSSWAMNYWRSHTFSLRRSNCVFCVDFTLFARHSFMMRYKIIRHLQKVYVPRMVLGGDGGDRDGDDDDDNFRHLQFFHTTAFLFVSRYRRLK